LFSDSESLWPSQQPRLNLGFLLLVPQNSHGVLQFDVLIFLLSTKHYIQGTHNGITVAVKLLPP